MIAHDCLFGACYGRLIGVLVATFLVSILYAIVLTFVENRWGVVSDYTWLAVVIGVAYTLGALAVLDGRAALLAFLLFAVSGTPIVARSIILDVRRRHELRRRLERRGNGDGSETVA